MTFRNKLENSYFKDELQINLALVFSNIATRTFIEISIEGIGFSIDSAGTASQTSCPLFTKDFIIEPHPESLLFYLLFIYLLT